MLAVHAAPTRAATPLEEAPQQLGKVFSKLPHAQTSVGACVIDLATGKPLFELHADEALIPASAQKVFTMTAALRTLGPDFTFKTVLALDGTNLVVIGDGDPSLADEKIANHRGEPLDAVLIRFVDALVASGKMVITGDIIIDESIFDDQRIHPSWEAGDLGKWYAAPVSALNINDNCLDVTALPGAAGKPATIVFRPENDVIAITNRCKSGSGPSPVLHHTPGTHEYIVNGICSKRWEFSPVAIDDPGLVFASALRKKLAARGCTVQGSIVRRRVRGVDGQLPSEIQVIAVESTPLADVFPRIGKDSQNLFAECLLKRTGYEFARRQHVASPQGSWSWGSQAVMNLLFEAIIDSSGFIMDDGSGLSRENRCTARQLAELLMDVARRGGAEADLFMDSLSLAGVDGSLRKRLKGDAGTIRGKTGTMRGVRSLAGYVDGPDGPRFAFAVMFNGYRGPSTPYREIQDRVCRILADVVETSETQAAGP